MKFLRSFNQALVKAVDYYKAIDPKLANRFVDAVDAAVKSVIEFPRIGRQIKNGREYLLKGFPYSFCYQEDFEGNLAASTLFHYKKSGERISQ